MSVLAAVETNSPLPGLIFLMAFFCGVSLLFVRPPRSSRAGTPHNVPFLAATAAFAWLLLVIVPPLFPGEPSVPNSTTTEAPPAEAASPFQMLTAVGLESLISTAILLFTYFSDRLMPSVADTAAPAPVPPVDEPFPVVEVAANERPPLSPDLPSAAAAGFRVGLAALVPVNLIAVLLSRLHVEHETHPLLEMMTSTDGAMFRTIIAFVAVVLAPVKEELLFRVILQGWLVDRIGRAGIVGASLIFAMVHGAENGFLLTPLALMLGLLYERTRSYAAVVAAHATFNGANLLMQFSVL